MGVGQLLWIRSPDNIRMRLCLSSAFLVLSFLITVSQGQGIFDNIFSTLNRLNPFRPSQQSSQPASRPSSGPSTPVFRPRPPSPSSSHSMPSTPVRVVQPPPAQAPTPPPGFSFGRLRIEPIATPGRGNHNFEGKTYLLSWKEGQNHFSWTQARDWCKTNGMKIVSLDSPAKRDHFLGLTSSQGVEFFWTGGRLSSDKTELMWENGVKQPIARGVHPWSHTGLRGPQPDGQGSEHCLAVLNNLYNDGVKFHDVGCEHDKATICE